MCRPRCGGAQVARLRGPCAVRAGARRLANPYLGPRIDDSSHTGPSVSIYLSYKKTERINSYATPTSATLWPMVLHDCEECT
jgi:hypothetical protein